LCDDDDDDFHALFVSHYIFFIRFSVITLEDVLEELLQEEIYDESDKMEREAARIAIWAAKKWKKYVQRRKQERALQEAHEQDYSMGSVVKHAMARHDEEEEEAAATGEGTALLGGGGKKQNDYARGLFGMFG
jgi:hypothetical protein